MKIEGKCRVTKCPGNSRVFTVIGETNCELGFDMQVEVGTGEGLLTTAVQSIESSSHAKNHYVVKTINSTYIVEKL